MLGVLRLLHGQPLSQDGVKAFSLASKEGIRLVGRRWRDHALLLARRRLWSSGEAVADEEEDMAGK